MKYNIKCHFRICINVQSFKFIYSLKKYFFMSILLNLYITLYKHYLTQINIIFIFFLCTPRNKKYTFKFEFKYNSQIMNQIDSAQTIESQHLDNFENRKDHDLSILEQIKNCSSIDNVNSNDNQTLNLQQLSQMYDVTQEIKTKDKQIRDLQALYQKNEAMMQQSIYFLTVQLEESKNRIKEQKEENSKLIQLLDTFKQQPEESKFIELQKDYYDQVMAKNKELQQLQEQYQNQYIQFERKNEDLANEHKIQTNAIQYQYVFKSKQQDEVNQHLRNQIKLLQEQILQDSNNYQAQIERLMEQKSINEKKIYEFKKNEHIINEENSKFIEKMQIESRQLLNNLQNQVNLLQSQIQAYSHENLQLKEHSFLNQEKHSIINEKLLAQKQQSEKYSLRINHLEKLLEESELSFIQLVQNGNQKQKLEISLLLEDNNGLQEELVKQKLQNKEFKATGQEQEIQLQNLQQEVYNKNQECLSIRYEHNITKDKLSKQIKDQDLQIELLQKDNEVLSINFNKQIALMESNINALKQEKDEQQSIKTEFQVLMTDYLQLKEKWEKSKETLKEVECFYGREIFQRDQNIKKIKQKLQDIQIKTEQLHNQQIQELQLKYENKIKLLITEIEQLKICLNQQHKKYQDLNNNSNKEILQLKERISIIENQKEQIKKDLSQAQLQFQQSLVMIQKQKEQEKFTIDTILIENKQLKTQNDHLFSRKELEMKLLQQKYNLVKTQDLSLQSMLELLQKNQQLELQLNEQKQVERQLQEHLNKLNSEEISEHKESFVSMLQCPDAKGNPTIEELTKAFQKREKELMHQINNLQKEFNSNNQNIRKESVVNQSLNDVFQDKKNILEQSYNEIKRTSKILDFSSNVSKKALWEIEKYQNNKRTQQSQLSSQKSFNHSRSSIQQTPITDRLNQKANIQLKSIQLSRNLEKKYSLPNSESFSVKMSNKN